MAIAHAGTKRSYEQMHDLDHGRSTFGDTSLSEQHPLPRPDSRVSSRAATPFDAVTRKDTAIRGPRKATFESSASIVLIGIRGVGKSTLGILAATAYNRHLIDSDKAFSEATGSTATAYRKLHGTDEYQRRHNEILENTLRTYGNDAVIVCGFSDLEKKGAALLRDFAQAHPVIHVSRDVEGIQAHLKVWTIERIEELLLASSPLLRSCSNFEFYNLSENGGRRVASASTPEQPPSLSSNGGFLTLKSAERDFLRLLRNVIGDHNRGPSHQSAYPLSQVRLEDRSYSFSVSVSVSEINARQLDLDEIQIGADCIELGLHATDSTRRPSLSDVAKAFATIRRATILPIMISPKVGGKTSSDSRKEALELIDQCLRLGPELCTVDLSMESTLLRQLIASKGNSKIIGALELTARPVGGWANKQCNEAYRRAAEIGCDLIKITMPAESVDDAFAIHAFRQAVKISESSPRLIAYCTGAKGRLSKIFNRLLTPVVPDHKAGEVKVDSEPGECSMTAKAINHALFSSFVLQPLQFFIFGADVSHSLSPPMHNAAYDACGMQYSCSTYSTDKLDDFKRLTRGTSFGGTAVAHPFKQTVAALMDGLSPHAKAIGAVNSVIPIRQLPPDHTIPSESVILARSREQGAVKALYGFNTDWIGIRACIRRGLSPANTIRPHSSALVCGAGGMARAAVYSLLSLGVQNIFVCNRTLTHATALADHYNNLVMGGKLSGLIMGDASQTHVRVLDTFASPWPTGVRYPTIIVNCIPRLGPDDSATSISLPEHWLKSPTGGVVVEVAYRLPVSPLIRQIKERAYAGWIVMDGFDVLPEQAYSQFELFTGRRAPRRLMRDEILRHCQLDGEWRGGR